MRREAALDGDVPSDSSARRGEWVSHATVSATEERILQGAIAALGRRGSHSLSMSDVATAANISRATLYRYFPTKVAVLEAMSEYISSSFVRGAEEIARTVEDPIARLRAVMSLQLELATRDLIARIIEVEPGFVLKFLAEHYTRHLAAVRHVLDPLFDLMERASGVKLDREVLAAALLRMQLSTVAVPADERWRASPDIITDMFGALLGAQVRSPGKQKPARRKSR